MPTTTPVATLMNRLVVACVFNPGHPGVMIIKKLAPVKIYILLYPANLQQPPTLPVSPDTAP